MLQAVVTPSALSDHVVACCVCPRVRALQLAGAERESKQAEATIAKLKQSAAEVQGQLDAARAAAQRQATELRDAVTAAQAAKRAAEAECAKARQQCSGAVKATAAAEDALKKERAAREQVRGVGVPWVGQGHACGLGW